MPWAHSLLRSSLIWLAPFVAFAISPGAAAGPGEQYDFTTYTAAHGSMEVLRQAVEEDRISPKEIRAIALETDASPDAKTIRRLLGVDQLLNSAMDRNPNIEAKLIAVYRGWPQQNRGLLKVLGHRTMKSPDAANLFRGELVRALRAPAPLSEELILGAAPLLQEPALMNELRPLLRDLGRLRQRPSLLWLLALASPTSPSAQNLLSGQLHQLAKNSTLTAAVEGALLDCPDFTPALKRGIAKVLLDPTSDWDPSRLLARHAARYPPVAVTAPTTESVSPYRQPGTRDTNRAARSLLTNCPELETAIVSALKAPRSEQAVDLALLILNDPASTLTARRSAVDFARRDSALRDTIDNHPTVLGSPELCRVGLFGRILGALTKSH